MKSVFDNEIIIKIWQKYIKKQLNDSVLHYHWESLDLWLQKDEQTNKQNIKKNPHTQKTDQHPPITTH